MQIELKLFHLQDRNGLETACPMVNLLHLAVLVILCKVPPSLQSDYIKHFWFSAIIQSPFLVFLSFMCVSFTSFSVL